MNVKCISFGDVQANPVDFGRGIAL